MTNILSQSKKDKSKKVVFIFVIGVSLLIGSTILICVDYYLNKNIEGKKDSLDRLRQNYQSYNFIMSLSNSTRNADYLGKLVTTEDTVQKNKILKIFENEHHNLEWQGLIISLPKRDINYENKIFHYSAEVLHNLGVENQNKITTRLNELEGSLWSLQKRKNIVMIFFFITQIGGLLLNQIGIILQIRYKI